MPKRGDCGVRTNCRTRTSPSSPYRARRPHLAHLGADDREVPEPHGPPHGESNDPEQPAHRGGEPRPSSAIRAQQEQRYRHHEEKRVALPRLEDRNTRHSQCGGDRHHPADQHLPKSDREQEPCRNRPVDEHRPGTDEEQQAVDDGIERGAEFAHLPESAGQPAIHPIRRPEGAEGDRGGSPAILDEQEPRHDRQTEQPYQGHRVRKRGDAAEHVFDGSEPAYPRRVPSVFTRIIARELPGTFVHEDAYCVAFMTINPIAPGHLLVVPRAEVDHWIDLDPVSAEATFAAARLLAEAQRRSFPCERVALVVAGFEVPHCHVHLIPASSMADLDFSRAATDVARADLENAAARIRAALPSA